MYFNYVSLWAEMPDVEYVDPSCIFHVYGYDDHIHVVLLCWVAFSALFCSVLTTNLELI